VALFQSEVDPFSLHSLANGRSAIGARLLGTHTIDIVDAARRVHWHRINPSVPFFGEGGSEDRGGIIEALCEMPR